jgi:hypothetical protein
MTTINDAYINALLADATYVKDLLPGDSPDNLIKNQRGQRHLTF